MLQAHQELRSKLNLPSKQLGVESVQSLLKLASPVNEQTIRYVDLLLQRLRVELLDTFRGERVSSDIPQIRHSYKTLSYVQRVALNRYDEVRLWLALHAPDVLSY